MFRTGSIFVGSALLGFFIFGGLIWISVSSHGFGIGQFYLLQALTGAAVGGVVGFFQRNRAGVIAMLSLLPAILFEYLTPDSLHHVLTGPGSLFLLFGSALKLSVSFGVAYALSNRARATKDDEPQEQLPRRAGI